VTSRRLRMTQSERVEQDIENLIDLIGETGLSNLAELEEYGLELAARAAELNALFDLRQWSSGGQARI
jgi:hypothetical protein